MLTVHRLLLRLLLLTLSCSKALAAEQHRLQTSRRRGVPDWTLPAGPAGVPSAGHERVPTFFAWERAVRGL